METPEVQFLLITKEKTCHRCVHHETFGEAVEGEGGITIMEIKAILPTMMAALAPEEDIGDRAQMLMQLLSQMGLNVRKMEHEIPHFDP